MWTYICIQQKLADKVRMWHHPQEEKPNSFSLCFSVLSVLLSKVRAPLGLPVDHQRSRIESSQRGNSWLWLPQGAQSSLSNFPPHPNLTAGGFQWGTVLRVSSIHFISHSSFVFFGLLSYLFCRSCFSLLCGHPLLRCVRDKLLRSEKCVKCLLFPEHDWTCFSLRLLRLAEWTKLTSLCRHFDWHVPSCWRVLKLV